MPGQEKMVLDYYQKNPSASQNLSKPGDDHSHDDEAEFKKETKVSKTSFVVKKKTKKVSKK